MTGPGPIRKGSRDRSGPGVGARSRAECRRVGPVGAALAVALLVGLVVGLVVGSVGPASAQDGSLSRAEAAVLARDAVSDPAALARLRSVTEIDGRRVDLVAVTAGPAAARAERLRVLAVELGGRRTGGGGDADAARASAQRVLADQKYEEHYLPRPFKGLLEWMADRLRPVGRVLDRVFGPVIRSILGLPGGAFILAALLAGVVGALSWWLVGRRSRAAVARSGGGLLVDPRADPEDLERQAEAAEAGGDRSAAVRLRYEAGLLRLARTDRIVLRADTTAEGAARQVGEPVMDRLTTDFEEVVYGQRVAETADVDRARTGWAELLGARSRR